MKKALYIYLIFTLFSILTSSSCKSPETHYFDWNNLNYSKQEIFYQNGFINYRETDKTTFAELTFGVNLRFEYNIFAALNNFRINSPYSLYATSYEDDIYILSDKVSYIKITTINDFDEEHLAGSDVTDYFSTLFGGDFKPVNSMVNGVNGLNTDRYEESQLTENYLMFLRENPTIQNDQQFQIEVKFGSGKSLAITTELITIE